MYALRCHPLALEYVAGAGSGEFIHPFLIHMLPKALHRIRHSGLLAGPAGAGNLARMRDLLAGKEQPYPAAVDAFGSSRSSSARARRATGVGRQQWGDLATAIVGKRADISPPVRRGTGRH